MTEIINTGNSIVKFDIPSAQPVSAVGRALAAEGAFKATSSYSMLVVSPDGGSVEEVQYLTSSPNSPALTVYRSRVRDLSSSRTVDLRGANPFAALPVDGLLNKIGQFDGYKNTIEGEALDLEQNIKKLIKSKLPSLDELIADPNLANDDMELLSTIEKQVGQYGGVLIEAKKLLIRTSNIEQRGLIGVTQEEMGGVIQKATGDVSRGLEKIDSSIDQSSRLYNSVRDELNGLRDQNKSANAVINKSTPDLKDTVRDVNKLNAEYEDQGKLNKELATDISVAEADKARLEESLRAISKELDALGVEKSTAEGLGGVYNGRTTEVIDSEFTAKTNERKKRSDEIEKISSNIQHKKGSLRAGTIRRDEIEASLSPRYDHQESLRRSFTDTIGAVKDKVYKQDLDFIKLIEKEDPDAIKKLRTLTTEDRQYFETEVLLRKKHSIMALPTEMDNVSLVQAVEEWQQLLDTRTVRIADFLWQSASNISSSGRSLINDEAKSLVRGIGQSYARGAAHERAGIDARNEIAAQYGRLMEEIDERMGAVSEVERLIAEFRSNSIVFPQLTLGNLVVSDILMKASTQMGEKRIEFQSAKDLALSEAQGEVNDFQGMVDSAENGKYTFKKDRALRLANMVIATQEAAKSGSMEEVLSEAESDFLGSAVEFSAAAYAQAENIHRRYRGLSDILSVYSNIDNGFIKKLQIFISERGDNLRGLKTNPDDNNFLLQAIERARLVGEQAGLPEGSLESTQSRGTIVGVIKSLRQVIGKRGDK